MQLSATLVQTGKTGEWVNLPWHSIKIKILMLTLSNSKKALIFEIFQNKNIELTSNFRYFSYFLWTCKCVINIKKILKPKHIIIIEEHMTFISWFNYIISKKKRKKKNNTIWKDDKTNKMYQFDIIFKTNTALACYFWFLTLVLV